MARFTSNTFAYIRRLADRINRRRRKKRRVPDREEPAGPKLAKGRGAPRGWSLRDVTEALRIYCLWLMAVAVVIAALKLFGPKFGG